MAEFHPRHAEYRQRMVGRGSCARTFARVFDYNHFGPVIVCQIGRRDNSVEEALIEFYSAEVRLAVWRTSRKSFISLTASQSSRS